MGKFHNIRWWKVNFMFKNHSVFIVQMKMPHTMLHFWKVCSLHEPSRFVVSRCHRLRSYRASRYLHMNLRKEKSWNVGRKHAKEKISYHSSLGIFGSCFHFKKCVISPWTFGFMSTWSLNSRSGVLGTFNFVSKNTLKC